MFGKDVEENIFMMITFCDTNQPSIIDVKASNISHSKYFEFNNSVLYIDKTHTDSDDKIFDKHYWRTGMCSMEDFFNDKSIDIIDDG